MFYARLTNQHIMLARHLIFDDLFLLNSKQNSTIKCSGFYSLSFFSEMQQGMMYRAAFSVLLIIATVTAQSDGISGCGGSVKVSQGILK